MRDDVLYGNEIATMIVPIRPQKAERADQLHGRIEEAAELAALMPQVGHDFDPEITLQGIIRDFGVNPEIVTALFREHLERATIPTSGQP